MVRLNDDKDVKRVPNISETLNKKHLSHPIDREFVTSAKKIREF